MIDMAILFFRTVDRRADHNGRHEFAGDLVGFLPDDHLSRGGDFGRLGRRENAWVRVPDCPDEDMLRGLCAEEPVGLGRRKRFRLDAVALRALVPSVPVEWFTHAWNPGVSIAEADCPVVPWAALVAACVDRDTGRKPHEQRLVEHFAQRRVDDIDKLIADEGAAGRSVNMDVLVERTAVRQKRDAAKSDADANRVRLVRP